MLGWGGGGGGGGKEAECFTTKDLLRVAGGGCLSEAPGSAADLG